MKESYNSSKLPFIFLLLFAIYYTFTIYSGIYFTSTYAINSQHIIIIFTLNAQLSFKEI